MLAVTTLAEFYELPFEQQEIVWKEYWVKKLGHAPNKIEKVVCKVSFEEDNRESEVFYRDFKAFIQSKGLCQ